MGNQMEIYQSNAEFKILDTSANEVEGTYEGHFSVFGNVDLGNDIVVTGAFAKTLAERGDRVKAIYMHDFTKLIGPNPFLKEDNIGLYAKGRLTLGSFWGREVYELMKDGAIDEGSFGFQTVKSKYNSDTGMRQLLELKLYEISPVPLGMNPATNIGVIKSFMTPNRILPHSYIGQAPNVVDIEWDEKKIVEEIVDKPNLFRKLFAFFNPDGQPDDIQSYKLLHHNVDGTVNKNALILCGEKVANVSTDISVEFLAPVKAHLEEHFESAGLEVPWKGGKSGLYENIQLLDSLTEKIITNESLVSLDGMQRQKLTDSLKRLLEELEQAEQPGQSDTHFSLDQSALNINRRMIEVRQNLLKL